MEIQKFAVTMIGTFVIGVLIYVATRIIFGFGEGLIAQQPFVKKLL
jgi:hypothetical protein